MKISFTFTLIFAMMAASFAVAQEEKTETTAVAWFDMENCEICKPFVKHMDMMQQIKWETHLIDEGFISVSLVPDKLKGKMAELKKEMKANIARAQKEEDVTCCGYCTSLGELLEAGANQQELTTAGGDIMMLTSKDPKLVAKLHAHAKKTIAEHKKMEEMMKQQGKSGTE